MIKRTEENPVDRESPRLRILVVEDNEAMREGMVQVLSKEGHEIMRRGRGPKRCSTWNAPAAISSSPTTRWRAWTVSSF